MKTWLEDQDDSFHLLKIYELISTILNILNAIIQDLQIRFDSYELYLIT